MIKASRVLVRIRSRGPRAQGTHENKPLGSLIPKGTHENKLKSLGSIGLLR